jgi:hypothetical protein
MTPAAPMRCALAAFAALLAGAAASQTAGQDAPEPVFGSRQWIEYRPGTLPIVISAPHGGLLRPEEIPDRAYGVTGADVNTQDLARRVAAALRQQTGGWPHLVVCGLHRSKLDANRPLPEAAQENADAGAAWEEYHQFIEQACRAAVAAHGFAFLIDLHGHGHPDNRVELGYLHTPEELAGFQGNPATDQSIMAAGSLAWKAPLARAGYADLMWGKTSLGALLEDAGFPSTPSPRMPVPSLPFFRGGYTIARHCRADSRVSGFQLEANRPRLRDTGENRERFALALATALQQYFEENWGLTLTRGKPSPAGGE